MKPSIVIPVVIAGGLLMLYSHAEPQTRGAEDTAVASRENLLKVPFHPQEGYRTCWAACAEMIMEFLSGDRWRQCEQAGVAFGVPACCVLDGVLNPASACDKQWHPEFDVWGFDSYFVPSDSQSHSGLTWDDFTAEIDEGGPILFGWKENPFVTHMLVAIGYHEVGGDRKIFYLDPLADATEEPIMESFSRFDGTSGVYPHKFDYISIRQR